MAAPDPSLALRFLRVGTAHRDAAGKALQYDTVVLTGLRDIRAAPGRLTAVLPVTPALSGNYACMHPGCIGELDLTVPICATLLLSRHDSLDIEVPLATARAANVLPLLNRRRRCCLLLPPPLPRRRHLHLQPPSWTPLAQRHWSP
jgi:hypothetical protein